MNFKSLAPILFLLYSFSVNSQNNPVAYVNPFIGTGGHGHTFPGAVLPFGMVQLSPDTRVDGSWDGCSGYHYSDNTIYGFSHTHLSGTGCSDWGDILLMPMTTKPSVDNKIYSSKFSHDKEKASAGYYSVMLEDEKINAELTTTLRTGIHRYTFSKTKEISVVLDLLHRDKLLSGNFTVLDSQTVVGYRVSQAWAREQYCFFAIKFSKPIKKTQYALNKLFVQKPDTLKKESSNAGIFSFSGEDGKPLIVRVGISGVSEKGALQNLLNEAPHEDFDKYKKEAELVWNKQLEKITVKESDANKLSTFYTALYHCCIHPSLNMDIDNQYRGRDNKIHTAAGFTNYNVFSLWDTYRGLHPLFTIIERKRTSDFINTFLTQYKQSNRLPVWELSGNETDCMIGYHSVSVIADAMTKGIGGFDTAAVYQSVKAAASYTGFSIPVFAKNGYLSADDEPESVSRTLEYAYDDWCIAQIMKLLRKTEDYNVFMKRSQGYKNVFDPSTSFMRPRKNGNWLSPFDAKEVNNYFTEGNSWQYSFYVPHDLDALIKLHGGPKKFETKLDSLFGTGSKTTGRDQSDITGLIGQYAHGNEPSHHMAYLYNFVGKPTKSQDLISKIESEFYKNTPDGLIGNEDCGQMSAWFVLSTLGFYPVCPGGNTYITCKPYFQQAQIHLENGQVFEINSSQGKYIKQLKTNSTIGYKPELSHATIMNGGSLTFLNTNNADSASRFGASPSSRPSTKTSESSIIPVPVIKSNSKTFENEQTITIENFDSKNTEVYYTTNGSEPNKKSLKYSGGIKITSSLTLKAKTYSVSDSSKSVQAVFFKRPNNWKIQLKSTYNKQYTAGGPEGIIDGVYGDVNWRKGEWQGYQNQDFECIIDLNEPKEISYVSVDCLQDTRSWIIFPTQITIYVSTDGKLFTPVETLNNSINANDYNTQIKKFEKTFAIKHNAKYVKVVAKNFGKLPEWHEGKGDQAFIFVDEIELK